MEQQIDEGVRHIGEEISKKKNYALRILVCLLMILFIIGIYLFFTNYTISSNEFSGGLEPIYKDFDGNTKNGKLIGRISISSQKGTCNFNIEFNGRERKITSENNSRLCKQYLKGGDKIDRISNSI